MTEILTGRLDGKVHRVQKVGKRNYITRCGKDIPLENLVNKDELTCQYCKYYPDDAGPMMGGKPIL